LLRELATQRLAVLRGKEDGRHGAHQRPQHDAADERHGVAGRMPDGHGLPKLEVQPRDIEFERFLRHYWVAIT